MKTSKRTYTTYLVVISLIGLVTLISGILQFPSYDQPINLLLLMALAAVAQVSATSMPVSERYGITVALGPAVALSALPLYGPAAAALIAAFSVLTIWIIRPANQKTWKRSLPQLAFNTGMQSTAIFVGGYVWNWATSLLGAETVLGATIPWVLAAIIYEELTLWLVIGIMRLQQGPSVDPLAIWRDSRWAVPISILILTLGSGLLSFAVRRFDFIGIVIFFLPIALSAYAFRLYVRQMQEHLDNLEKIVADRTHELAELNQEKDAFLAVLTHDMKTPLTSIGLYAQLIRDHPMLLQQKPHMTEIIMRSQRTLIDIVNNILDLAHLEAGREMPIKLESVDLVALVDFSMSTVLAQAEEKSIALTSQLPSDSLIIQADRQQMERVMMNLISNAVKYTPDGGTVTVRLARQAESVCITVEDTGYGIPPDELPYIFDRYRRVNKHRDKAVGTGLGLAITKALIESHQGTVEVESEEGVGTRFTVELPYTEPALHSVAIP